MAGFASVLPHVDHAARADGCSGGVLPPWWPATLRHLPSESSTAQPIQLAIVPAPLLPVALMSVVAADPGGLGEEDPLCSVVWPAAQALASELLSPGHTELAWQKLQGARVLDLGCGTGVAGVAAALAGAAEVVLVDTSTRALRLSLLTAAANGITPDEASLIDTGLPAGDVLAAARAAALHAGSAGGDAIVRTQALDIFGQPEAVLALLGGSPFDVVLCGDVLYYEGGRPETKAAGLAALVHAVVAPGGSLLLADARRHAVAVAHFFRLACAEGEGPTADFGQHAEGGNTDETCQATDAPREFCVAGEPLLSVLPLWKSADICADCGGAGLACWQGRVTSLHDCCMPAVSRVDTQEMFEVRSNRSEEDGSGFLCEVQAIVIQRKLPAERSVDLSAMD